jgi:intracellular septation protein
MQGINPVAVTGGRWMSHRPTHFEKEYPPSRGAAPGCMDCAPSGLDLMAVVRRCRWYESVHSRVLPAPDLSTDNKAINFMQKFLFDFFPVLLFFVVFKLYPSFAEAETTVCLLGLCIPGGSKGAIYAATLTAIAASFLQLAIYWRQHHRLENMHLITLGLLVVLGGATLVFQDDTFIKWKPTAVNWLFALVFLGSHFIGGKPLIRRMMEKAVTLKEEKVWTWLNMSWVVFFIAMGVLNLYVAFTFSTDFWVNFKLFGLMGLTVLFVIGQAFFLTRYIEEPETETPADNGNGPST